MQMSLEDDLSDDNGWPDDLGDDWGEGVSDRGGGGGGGGRTLKGPHDDPQDSRCFQVVYSGLLC